MFRISTINIKKELKKHGETYGKPQYYWFKRQVYSNGLPASAWSARFRHRVITIYKAR